MSTKLPLNRTTFSRKRRRTSAERTVYVTCAIERAADAPDRSERAVKTVPQRETGGIGGPEKYTDRRRVFSRSGLRKRTLYAIIYM